MSDAYLVAHFPIEEDGELGKPRYAGIYSEQPEGLTRLNHKECLLCVLTGQGGSFEEARNAIFDKLAVSLKLYGPTSEFKWVINLMNERDVEDVNDAVESPYLQNLEGRFELENGGSQPKPR